MTADGAAFYARKGGGLRQCWSVLHPPYTAWHLSYVVIGATLAPVVSLETLVATLLAFFLAVGVAAHALDELKDRPLGTSLPSAGLALAGGLGLAGAVVLGVEGVVRIGWALVPFIVVGTALVLAYDLEWWGGILHNDAGFAAAWGAFPVLTSYFAQARTIGLAAAAAAGGALALSAAQRNLSTAARTLRRRAVVVEGRLVLADSTQLTLSRAVLLGPLESALKALCWSIVALALALALAKMA